MIALREYLDTLRVRLEQGWGARQPRERQLLGGLAGLLLLALLQFLWTRGWEGVARLEQELPGMRHDLERLQGLSAPVQPPQVLHPQALLDVLQRQGRLLNAGLVQFTARDKGVEMIWAGADFSVLAHWLDRVASTVRVRVVEADVQRVPGQGLTVHLILESGE
ncbi:type II secretion system protein GspM [Ferrovum myxofaciens]|jgi:type II secretory pathway component PulM|uniref:Type II secretion system protein M n=1 Tax=Ferrovum myxofaciens TaxID=416213 RepID=A0A9E6SYC6_9PROT|nr:type II secretion system protein GspM [Ferrovum myxofaciens]MBU6994002.1 type II secretion system protein M [Ferrovum myxofaciens]QKE37953.1 MAG: type II secretion system protein M [Ferrovum myxofaciens]QWY75647.1 MAG: type II secretion system protein M [Ferrovum myxofaciens]QWY78383.1 MAG: type II secretion system protein M [Ferrovum myxofaciens]